MKIKVVDKFGTVWGEFDTETDSFAKYDSFRMLDKLVQMYGEDPEFKIEGIKDYVHSI